MKYFRLIPYYLGWHYSTALADLILIWKNYLWFSLNYFSVKILFKSILKPFRLVNEKYSHRKLDNELKIVTLFNYVFGFLIKNLSITAGIFLWAIILVLGLIFLITWVFLPVIILFLLMSGGAGLMSNN